MADFAKTFRRTTYPFISPTKASSDQSGRTVLITGGSQGIGFGIAGAFAKANAAHVIIASRSQEKLDQAVQKLTTAHPKTQVTAIRADVLHKDGIEALWSDLSSRKLTIDILVLNAAATVHPAMDDLEGTIEMFHCNIDAHLRMLSHFRKQPNSQQSQRILVSVASAGLQCYNHDPLAYAASKAGLANYIAHLADFVKEPELRLINFHPGAVYTTAAEKSGEVSPDLPIWDDPSLSSDMAVWLCGKEAAFLHGRYLWANWDAEELVNMKERIEENGLLKIGVVGNNSFTVPDLIKACTAFPLTK